MRRWRGKHPDEPLWYVEVTPEDWDRLGDGSRDILYLGPGLGIAFVRVEPREMRY